MPLLPQRGSFGAELALILRYPLQTWRSYGAYVNHYSALKGQDISAMGAAHRHRAERKKPWKGEMMLGWFDDIKECITKFTPLHWSRWIKMLPSISAMAQMHSLHQDKIIASISHSQTPVWECIYRIAELSKSAVWHEILVAIGCPSYPVPYGTE